MKCPRIIITALISLSTILCIQKHITAAPDTPVVKLIKVQFASTDQVAQLGSMGLDIWEVNADHVIAAADAELVARIQQQGFSLEVISDDAWNYLKTQSARAARAAAATTATYHSYAEVITMLTDMEASGVAQTYNIGTSVEGRDIWAVRISDNPALDEDEPSVLFVGCHHAREWISVEVPLYLGKYLTDHYATDPEITSLVDNQQIWIVPVLNPDGYEYSRSTNRSWRKNRRYNGGGKYGVDLNRNYGYMWGDDAGSSGDRGSGTYRGPEAFSEPETRALRDLCLAHDFRSMITYHSYGSEVACTWGYTLDPTPDFCRDRHMADVMETLINNVHNAGYTSPEIYGYITSGDTTDWTYGMFRIPSITIELRPKTSSEGGFILPEDQIIPACEENLPAALYLIKWNPADLNSDNTVNLGDLAILSSYWLRSGCNLANLCCDGADIFGNNTVDMIDMALFANEWCTQSIIDPIAPSPDPMTWASVPVATGDSSIVMTASAATDISGVEYYFTCTAGGGNDSGWQDSRTYVETGLTPETQYTYTVIARDKSVNHNVTAASAAASATTDTQDTVKPIPNPMTWNTIPYSTTYLTISMTATAASDSSGVEYFFDCITPGGHDSGWQDSTSYTDNGLTPETSYTYTVMARDKSNNQNTTDPSAPHSATTLAVSVGPWVGTDKAIYAPGEDIVVYFANAGGNLSDWVGFYNDGDANGNYLDYIYLGGVVSGSVTYGGFPDAGDYDVRLFFNDSYTLEASNDFTVE
jgi:chitodextrinase